MLEPLSTTIEAIGKYQLISGPPIKIHVMHSKRHVNSPIFRAESNGSIFRNQGSLQHGPGGHVEQLQGVVHDDGG